MLIILYARRELSDSQNYQLKYEVEKHWGVTIPGDLSNIAYTMFQNKDKTNGTFKKIMLSLIFKRL